MIFFPQLIQLYNYYTISSSVHYLSRTVVFYSHFKNCLGVKGDLLNGEFVNRVMYVCFILKNVVLMIFCNKNTVLITLHLIISTTK